MSNMDAAYAAFSSLPIQDTILERNLMPTGTHIATVAKVEHTQSANSGRATARLRFECEIAGSKAVAFLNLNYGPQTETKKSDGKDYFTFTPTNYSRQATACEQLGLVVVTMESAVKSISELAEKLAKNPRFKGNEDAAKKAAFEQYTNDLAARQFAVLHALEGRQVIINVVKTTYANANTGMSGEVTNVTIKGFADAATPTA